MRRDLCVSEKTVSSATQRLSMRAAFQSPEFCSASCLRSLRYLPRFLLDTPGPNSAARLCHLRPRPSVPFPALLPFAVCVRSSACWWLGSQSAVSLAQPTGARICRPHRCQTCPILRLTRTEVQEKAKSCPRRNAAALYRHAMDLCSKRTEGYLPSPEDNPALNGQSLASQRSPPK